MIYITKQSLKTGYFQVAELKANSMAYFKKKKRKKIYTYI